MPRLHTAEAVGHKHRDCTDGGGELVVEGGELGLVRVALEGICVDIELTTQDDPSERLGSDRDARTTHHFVARVGVDNLGSIRGDEVGDRVFGFEDQKLVENKTALLDLELLVSARTYLVTLPPESSG
jgi:hypothetical protein